MSSLTVFQPARFVRLIASDSMNVARDPMLIIASVMSLAPAPLLYAARPALDAAALSAFGVTELSRYLMPLVLIIPAMLIGWVTGFLLLEDRDDGPLLAVDVTPVGKGGFLIYRGAVAAAITGAITLWACRLLIPDSGWVLAVLIAVLVGIEAVLAAVILPAIARNKVEGLALTKLTNLAAVVPLLAIVPSPWRYTGGFFPTYWVGELLALSSETYLPLAIIIVAAITTHAAAAILVFKLLGRRAG
jgi:hypothetical protein